MNVIGLQFDIAWEDKPVNFRTAEKLLGQVAPPPDSLVALPEMFASGFSMNAAGIAEPRDGETGRFLAELARQHRITLVAGVAIRDRDGQARNKALVFSPAGELVAFYGKQRPFSPGLEGLHYAPGGKCTVFEWQGARVAPFICYDLRFPELFRAAAAVHQPELFIVIANFPAKRVNHWVQLLRARAIENQAYVVGVNRIGVDPHYQYDGRSLIIDPLGEIIADGGTAAGAVRAALDLDNLAKYRHGLPFLADLKWPPV